jgi:hemoglobin-like flavoprotein
MLSDRQVENIRLSFAALAPQATIVIKRFYQNLFTTHPEVRKMFPAEMNLQREHLLSALRLIVKNVDHLEIIQAPLREMGIRHIAYGTLPAHYPIIRDTLTQSMKEIAGALWNDTLQRDWTDAINAVAAVMIEGAESKQKAA